MALTEAADAVPTLIQTALAPMFLLAAIGSTLAVIDTRLNRIVDRARALESRLVDHPEHAPEIHAEAEHFVARARLIAFAVALCTLTALSVAAVVVLIFFDLQSEIDLSVLVELVFTIAVVLYVGALALYLRDVFQVGAGLEFVRGRIAKSDAAKP